MTKDTSTQFAAGTRVAIIDSGAGCLAIAKEIQQRDMGIDIHCIADRAFFPYGLKPDDALIVRLKQLVKKTMAHIAPDVIILACNTASTLALASLRDKWSTPFIGVVPAIKPAALHSNSNSIGVLSTRATAQRDYLNKLIADFACGTRVHTIGSATLVELAENQLINQTLDSQTLQQEINALLALDDKIDHIVLACTHFPLLKTEIEKLVAYKGIQVIDSTRAIANRLQSIINTLNKTEQGPLATQIDRQKPKPANTSINIYSTNDEQLDHYARFLSTPTLQPTLHIHF